MGYTHYFTTKKTINQKTFDSLRNEFLIIATNNNWVGNLIKIVYNEKKVFSFNGVNNTGHENCFINRTKLGFNFCKTNKKPYDIAVRVFLGILKEKLDDDIMLSTDDPDPNIFTSAYAKYK